MAFGFYDNLLQGGDFSMADLDAISATHPIFLLYVNGHVGAVEAGGATGHASSIGRGEGRLVKLTPCPWQN